MTTELDGNDTKSRKLSPAVRRLLAHAADLLDPGTREEFQAACDAEAAKIDAEREAEKE